MNSLSDLRVRADVKEAEACGRGIVTCPVWGSFLVTPQGFPASLFICYFHCALLSSGRKLNLLLPQKISPNMEEAKVLVASVITWLT